MNWLEEFSPSNPDEWLVGQQIKKQMYVFFTSWFNNQPIFKAVLLYGHRGCGKSSAISAYETSFNLKIIKHNLSELTPAQVRELVFDTQRPVSIEGKNIAILFDEIDGCHEWEAFKDIIKYTKVPIIMTANWIDKIPKLDDSIYVEIQYPRDRMKIQHLRRICDAKNLDVDDEKLTRIAEVCKTFRGCVMTLQKCVLNNTWRRIERPIDDMGPEDELLGIYHGKISETEWEIPEFLRYSIVNGVSTKELEDLKTTFEVSKRVSLDNIPYEMMMLCRSNVGKINRPPWRGYKRQFRNGNTTKSEDSTDKIDLKMTSDKKILKQKVSKRSLSNMWG